MELVEKFTEAIWVYQIKKDSQIYFHQLKFLYASS